MDSDNKKSKTLVGEAKEVGDASEESMEYWSRLRELQRQLVECLGY